MHREYEITITVGPRGGASLEIVRTDYDKHGWSKSSDMLANANALDLPDALRQLLVVMDSETVCATPTLPQRELSGLLARLDLAPAK